MLIRRYVIRLGRPYNSSCIRAASSGSGKSFLERAACVLGLDEESRRRREQKRAIKDIVGTAFQGTGLLGKVWASLVTKFAVQVLGAFSSSMRDFNMIHEAAQKAILKDKNVRAALGNDIICEQPFSSSMNSMEANGKQLKMITLVFEVSGTVSSGRGNVSAEIGKDGLVKLKSLAITLAGGRQISVNVGNKPAPTIIDV